MRRMTTALLAFAGLLPIIVVPILARTKATLALQDNLNGWLNLQQGENLELIGASDFSIGWLFGVSPCEAKAVHKFRQNKASVACKIKAADGNYAITVHPPANGTSPQPTLPPDHPVHIFIRVGGCKPCLKITPREPDPLNPIMSVPPVAIGCDADHNVKIVPHVIRANTGAHVMWIAIGPDTNTWTVKVTDPQACGQGDFSNSGNGTTTCTIGSAKGNYEYTATNSACSGSSASGKISVIK